MQALAARGVAARWVAWDDPAVAWAEARLVVVRSPWDYDRRREEFLGWARSVGPRLVNPAPALAWNTDKGYLLDLAGAGVPVVPSVAVEDAADLASAVGRFPRAVVKPRVGAGGRGVVVLERGFGASPTGARLARGPWLVQPLMESVRSEGETSVFVLGGTAVSQARKVPAGAEIRVHEEHGGRTEAVPLADEAAGSAVAAVRAAERLLGVALPYARADLMRGEDGRLLLSELEVTEPGLYLNVLPGNAAAFAEVVAGLLCGLPAPDLAR